MSMLKYYQNFESITCKQCALMKKALSANAAIKNMTKRPK